MNCTRLSGMMIAATVTLTAGASELHLQFPEVVHTADLILDGEIIEIESYYSGNGQFISTDITLDVIDLIHLSADGVIDDDATVTITVAGGQVGETSLWASSMPSLAVGERIIGFLQHDGRKFFNPFVGGSQGLFIIDEDAADAPFPVTRSGRAIIGVDGTELIRTPVISWINGSVAHFETEFAGLAEAPLSQVPSHTAKTITFPTTGTFLDVNEFKDLVYETLQLPRNLWDVEYRLAHTPPDPRALEIPTLDPQRDNQRSRKQEVFTPTADGSDDAIDGGQSQPASADDDAGSASRGATNLCVCGYFDLHLVMQQVPDSWWSYNDNENSMAIWNWYMDVYRYSDSDGTFGDNNENEFCGWPDTWPDDYSYTWGAGHIAVCFTWSNGCGEISQADIGFNPAFSWTDDFDVSYGGTAILYQPTVAHELGHSWGFQRRECDETYDYNRLSVMHAYYSDIVENGWDIHSGDAWGIRTVYDDQTSEETIVNVGTESYYSNSSGSLTNTTTDDDTYYPGDSLTVENTTAENMSSSATSDVHLRVYLSTNQNITESDTLLGDWNWSSMGSQSWWTGDLTGTIPSSTPAGTYWVGTLMTVDGYDADDKTGNNKTWITEQVEILALPTGACCLGATCSTQTQVDCESAQGSYQGDGTSCTGNPCDDISCVCSDVWVAGDRIHATVDGPAGADGIFENHCGTVICGNDSGSLKLLIEWDDWSEGHDNVGSCQCGDNDSAGTDSCWWVTCSDVAAECIIPDGACCVMNACSVSTEEDCNAAGGTYLGDNTSCVGAPCSGLWCACEDAFQPGDRIHAVADSPAGSDGILAGDCGTVLCGKSSGSLYMLIEWDDWSEGHDNTGLCECGDDTSGGTDSCWWVECDDVALTCTPPQGACCFGTACDEMGEDHCNADGGTWLGEGTTCADNPCDDITCACDNEGWVVGDRVHAVVDNPSDSVGIVAGLCGKVLCGNSEFGMVLVAFDAWAGGHDGNGFCDCGGSDGPTGQSWWVSCDEIASGCVECGDLDDCPADLNNDLFINVSDLLIVLDSWGAVGPPVPSGDANGDCVVNVQDLLAVIDGWGECPFACTAGFVCGEDEPADFLCGDDCYCFSTYDGGVECIQDSTCADLTSCTDGNCPVGFACIVDTCCADYLCMPLCDDSPAPIPPGAKGPTSTQR